MAAREATPARIVAPHHGATLRGLGAGRRVVGAVVKGTLVCLRTGGAPIC